MNIYDIEVESIEGSMINLYAHSIKPEEMEGNIQKNL